MLNTLFNSEQANPWKEEVFVPRQVYRSSIACIHGPLSSFSFSCRFQGYLQIETFFRVIVQVCERDILKESEQLVWPQLTLTESLRVTSLEDRTLGNNIQQCYGYFYIFLCLE